MHALSRTSSNSSVGCFYCDAKVKAKCYRKDIARMNTHVVQQASKPASQHASKQANGLVEVERTQNKAKAKQIKMCATATGQHSGTMNKAMWGAGLLTGYMSTLSTKSS